ncbi:PAS domain S-box protein [Paraflavisolibacter sp. H34]|uniref:PAS domain S-box protein n=1 Tax=Huijunlia imazamoxiresistens TaxID=3127457 RepID=UPI003017EE7B
MQSVYDIQQDALGILNAAPDNYLILLPDVPRFTIVGVTEGYLKATYTRREELLGKGVFEAFPDNPNLQGSTGVENLRASLFHVIEQKQEHSMGELRYDVPNPNGGFVFKIWRSGNRPVFNAAGELQYIIHITEDVTALVKAEQRKIKAEERFQNIFEAVQVSIWEKDYSRTVAALEKLRQQYGNGLKRHLQENKAEVYRLLALVTVNDTNPASLKMFEAESKAQLLQEPSVVFTEESLPAVIDEMVAIARNDKSFQAEYVLQTLQGRKIVCLTTITSNNDYGSVLVTHSDITDLKKTGQALQESEVRFRTMANSIPQLAWMTDETGYIYWYNDRWYDYTGTTPEEMLGWGWQKVHHPDLVEGVVYRIQKAFDSGSAWEDIFLLRSREGEYRWFLSRALPVRKEDGTLLGWFGTNTDITEQRRTEEALEKSEEQLLLAMKGGELGYFDYTPRTGNLKWSARAKELFGLPPDAPVDFSVYLGALYPQDRERTQAAIQKALDPEIGMYENEYRVIGVTDGRLRWIRSKGKTFFDEQGTAYRLAGVMLDITKQKEAEEALQKSESNLRNLVLQAPVAMCIGSGPSFVMEVANDRMLELLDKHPGDIMGRPVFDVLTEAGEQGLKQVVQRVYATGKRFTANEMPVSLPRNNRMETVFLNFVYEPIKNREGAVTKIIAVAIDVTDQVVARKKVEESQKEFQSAMDFLPQIIWLTRPDGYHYYYNKQYFDYSGLTYDEAKGSGWHQIYHPDDQERTWQLWQHCLATGEPYEIEYRIRRHDGPYRWFLARALPLRDETGAITKWFGTCTDIHDQKTFSEQLERMVAERTKELHRSNEELQQFVHVSSHDLKEPVRKIKTFVNRIEEAFHEELGETGRFYLSRVQTAANRIFAMIDGVLTYSTISAWEEIYEPVDLNEVIKSVEFDLELAIQQTGATLHYGPLPRLEGAPVMLHQLFYNLISNSLKFARAGVPPVITITSEILEHQGKAFVCMDLQDNGIGFEQKYAEKIFGTFVRLHAKDKYEGAGLGLALCKKIVERHGGSIVAKSAAMAGTIIEIKLPLKKAGMSST